MTTEITTALSRLTVGAPAHAGALQMFPLFPADGDMPAGARYAVLREAMAAGTGRVTEVSAQGQVPLLRFRNDADQPVLLIDGEELVGCKQNRILNVSILAPARGDVEIPVSCVEMGRWRSESDRFHSEGRTMYAGLRAAKLAQVSRSLHASGAYQTDQGEIWASISAKSRRMGSRSATEAMSGLYEQREAEIKRISGAMQAQPGQIGAAFAVRGRLAGVELFDASVTLIKYLPGLVAGYALDALDDFEHITPWAPAAAPVEDPMPPDAGPQVSMQAVRELLARIAAGIPTRQPGVGLGEDLRITDGSLVGAALVDAGRVVHLCAFTDAAQEPSHVISRRRRRVSRPD